MATACTSTLGTVKLETPSDAPDHLGARQQIHEPAHEVVLHQDLERVAAAE
ncbi:MAG TPA: hypothetical protein VE359_18065 [Vicinamibacteria bacterium]|nr:hypothetical protein [Vicinamibacteria bacterium]